LTLKPPSPLCWRGDHLEIIDQTRLPGELVYLQLHTLEEVVEAIKNLRVRGAPAIGIAAAFGLYLGIRESRAATREAFLQELEEKIQLLTSTRPTAVNLFWALDRIKNRARVWGEDPPGLKELILREAQAIFQEEEDRCRKIGEEGAALLEGVRAVLTYCNAGTLATARYGTALAPIYFLAERGRLLRVFVCETRPLLQGVRLTAWELSQAGIPVTLITDNMAPTVMARGWVEAVIVGADRIVANGDTANKIGTYGLAILAREHGLSFYVAAPTSSFDLTLEEGHQIPIEERDPREVTHLGGVALAPQGVEVFNPAFDVTPHRYITAFITEKGPIYPPFSQNIKARLLRERS